MSIFKSIWYLGGLESIDPRVSANDDAYGRTYGNRVATRKAFPPLGSTRPYQPHDIDSRSVHTALRRQRLQLRPHRDGP